MIDPEREGMFQEYNVILDNLKTKFMEKWIKTTGKNVKPEDFEHFRTVGTGAFGRVILVRHKPTSAHYAMKILDKAKLVKTKQVGHTLNEKRILECVNFPFIVFMEFFFKARIEN